MARTDRWDRQIASLGAPNSDQFSSENPAIGGRQFISPMRDGLNWHANHWTPIEAELKRLGFRCHDFVAESPPNLTAHGELLRLRDAARDRLPAVLMARVNLARRQKVDAELGALIEALKSNDCHRSAAAAQALRASVQTTDHVAYGVHYSRVVKLYELRGDLNLRNKLLSKLAPGAPAGQPRFATDKLPMTPGRCQVMPRPRGCGGSSTKSSNAVARSRCRR